jgi:hypothetical protein
VLQLLNDQLEFRFFSIMLIANLVHFSLQVADLEVFLIQFSMKVADFRSELDQLVTFERLVAL